MSENDFTPNQIRLSYKRPERSTLVHVKNPYQAARLLSSTLEEGVLDLKEYMWVLLLTNDNRLLGISEVTSGTINGISFLPREVLQLSLLANAASVILIHNHPSGDLEPSEEDIEMTQKFKEMAEYMHITLQDHLIITSENHNSINSYL